jgi:two-component system, NtrC family, sensor kinase
MEILIDVLSRHHEVTGVSSSTDALARVLAGERYDAILCDVLMPRLSGLEVYEALVRQCPEQAERMVFITGEPTRGAESVFPRNVNVPHLRKPFGVDDVLSLVREVARK